jgi:glycosyltransferase involved in cell wall biosynthesis
MNCFNGETYLREAIDSVINQTYKNWEIIFWDNQSRDSSAEIVKSYKDERIKYFYAEVHTNLGKARSLAIEKSSGEWIGFLDTDDIWLQDKLEEQVHLVISKDSSVMVYGGTIFFNSPELNIDRDLEQYALCPLKEGNIYNQLILKNFIPMPSVLINKKIINEIGGIDKKLSHALDYDLWLRVSQKHNIYAVQKIICKYRFHLSNTTNKLGSTISSIEPLYIINKHKINKNYPEAIKFYIENLSKRTNRYNVLSTFFLFKKYNLLNSIYFYYFISLIQKIIRKILR